MGAPLAAPPTFVRNLALLPTADGHLLAFETDRGGQVWRYDGLISSTPAASDALVFLANAEHVTALRQADGSVVWQVPFAGTLVAPLVWDQGWLLGAERAGQMRAFRGEDGAEVWRRDLGSDVNSPPVLSGDRVYAALADGRVVALDVATGSTVWERHLGDKPNEMLARDGRVYVGSDDNYFYSLNATDGTVNWRWRTGGDVVGAPLADDRLVYFVSKDNVLRALDRRSGAQRWKRALPGRPTRGVVRVGDTLLVSGLSAKVTAYAVRDGAPAGEVTAPGEVASAPHVAEVRGLPQVVLVSRDIEAGTRIAAFRRSVDPLMDSPLPVLPNPLVIPAPGTPRTPPSGQ